MKQAKRIFCTACAVLLGGTLVGCGGDGYFDDSLREAEKVGDIGGNETLTLEENADTFLLENENVRLVLNKKSGSIRELANKEVGVYLVRNARGDIPLAIEYVEGRFSYGFEDCEHTLLTNSAEEVAVKYTWTYARDLRVESTISLKKNADEVTFSLDLFNNVQSDSVYSVEYPYISDVGQLYSAETDKFFHSYANGYVFDDPVKLFNRDDFNGVQWYMGLYPYGFGSTMQFMSYYVEDYGGFHLQTYDKGYTIKSFTAVGTGNNLHFGIRHYLDDICSGDKEFYKIGISNLTQGTWTESCDKYYEFAQETPWAEKRGKLIEEDESYRAFYEQTTLVNFAPHLGHAASAWMDWENVYNTLKENAGGGKIFNIIGNDWQLLHTDEKMNGEFDTIFPAVLDENLYAQMQEDDYTAFFEFNNMYNTRAAEIGEQRSLRFSQATKDRYVNAQILGDSVNNSISWWYMCPTDSWYEFAKEKTDVFTEDYDVDFLYHDCGYCVAPRTCFDTSHAHGTRVNIVEDEIAFLDRLREESGKVIGEELISEVFVGTVGYYQARANAGGMGFMDINDIRIAVEQNAAHKVSAFDYVYHEYGILRTDGYMKPLKESGDMYYQIMAFTALNGGVPQYNYEYIKAAFNENEMVEEMLSFLNALGSVKTGDGKNYLTYGKMVPAPDTGAGKVEYSYLNTSAIGETVFRGKAIVDKVVTSAFQYGGKTALFLSNITAEDLEVKFILQAGRDYGTKEGTVTQDGKQIAKIREGKANIKMTLPSREVVMLIL